MSRGRGAGRGRRWPVAAALVLLVALVLVLALPATAAQAQAAAGEAAGAAGPSGVLVRDERMVVDREGGTLAVIHLALVTNLGPGAVQAVEIGLPPGHGPVEPRAGAAAGDLSPTPAGVSVRVSLAAGAEHVLALAYALPVTPDGTLVKAFLHPTETFLIAVPTGVLRIHSDHVVDLGQIALDDRAYRQYGVGQVPAGALLVARVTEARTPLGRLLARPWLVLAALAVAGGVPLVVAAALRGPRGFRR